MKPLPVPCQTLLRVVLAAGATLGCLRTAALGGEPGPRPPVNVVLVHGILNTGQIFAPLAARLERQGCRCFLPSLVPNTGSLGIRDLARKLSTQIDRRFGPRAPVVLVGFSMGGIVTRDYVQNLATRGRVRGVFLISAPNHGTFWANLSPGGGIRDLASGSPFLQRLNADDSIWQHIPVSSYWTPYDLMIVPARSSLWPVGDTIRVVCPLHPMMPGNRVVMSDIAAKVARLPCTPGRQTRRAGRCSAREAATQANSPDASASKSSNSFGRNGLSK